jgi:uncharacterized small protein (DUF1192 family)
MKHGMMFLLVLATLGWHAPVVYAQDATEGTTFVDENGDGIDDNARLKHRFGHRHGGMLLSVVSAQLTEEQRAALQEKINALIAAGATHTEIQNAVFTELESFGIDVTALYLNRYSSVLTEEQMAALKTKIDVLKAEGATFDTIHTAIRTELASLGITWPGKGNDLDRLGTVLTAEQLATLQAKVDALVAEGASREAIHEAIHAELTALGVDIAPKGKGGPLRGGPKNHGPQQRPPVRRGH